VANGEIREVLAGWLSRLGLAEIGERRGFWRGVPRQADAVHRTRALPKFIEILRPLSDPLVLDLGPAVGANVEFLGTHLRCKVLIEDLFGDVEQSAGAGLGGELPARLAARFPAGDGLVDGVLCWDLFDYLDDDASGAVAREVARVLKPGGVALTMFSTERLTASVYTKYVVIDAGHLQHRWYGAARPPAAIRLVGQALKLFPALEPIGSYLLVHQQREVLFRKPL
jgi:SAM-dependent methyltransferase